MIKEISILFFSVITLVSSAQTYDANRFVTSMFPSILVTNNIVYGEAPVWTIPYGDQDLLLNVSVPDADDNPNRPLIIFAHAGGFINGSKDVDDMVAICDSFARKGFVTATIGYRKGFNPLSGGSSERAVYRGIQDGKTAIRYFKTYASLYDIDTNFVFFGGMSAGGFIATHVAVMDKESERPASSYGSFGVNDLECLDCGSHTGVSSSVRGVLDYWGAVQDTSIVEGNVPPMLLMHGENDPTVPFVYGHPFGVITLPEVYGSQPIKERLDSIGGTYEYITSTGPLHMLDGSDNGTWNPSPNAFWGDTLLPETTNFIYNLIKPNTEIISQQSIFVCEGDTAFFEVSPGVTPNSHYVWGFDNVVTNEVVNTNTETIELAYTTAGNYLLKVVEFNEILCAGDTLEFQIEVYPSPFADFVFSSSVAEVMFTNTSTNGDIYAWDFGDGLTSTDEHPSHIYTSNGDYIVTLVVTSTNGCVSEESSQLVEVESLGLEISEISFNVINPFDNELIINSNSLLNNIAVFSLDGRLMYSTPLFNGEVIQTSDWNVGLYILQMTDENGVNHQVKVVKL
jgi:PKD repeat protein/acetyl esterase/lipase